MDQSTFYDHQFHRPVVKNGERLSVVSRRHGRVLELIEEFSRGESRPLDVLELSLGDGDLTLAICSEMPSIGLTSADISVSRIEAARGRLGGNISRCRFLELNFDTEFSSIPAVGYDVVIAVDILEHVFDVFNFVTNCHRVLRAGGLFLVRVPNIGYVKRRLELATGQFPTTAGWFGRPGKLDAWRDGAGWDGGHLHLFTVSTLRQLLESSGFRLRHIEDPGSRFERWRSLAPSLLCGNLFVTATRL